MFLPQLKTLFENLAHIDPSIAFGMQFIAKLWIIAEKIIQAHCFSRFFIPATESSESASPNQE
jgi:hypothetical protein